MADTKPELVPYDPESLRALYAERRMNTAFTEKHIRLVNEHRQAYLALMRMADEYLEGRADLFAVTCIQLFVDGRIRVGADGRPETCLPVDMAKSFTEAYTALSPLLKDLGPPEAVIINAFQALLNACMNNYAFTVEYRCAE